jgi:hypothetical protein
MAADLVTIATTAVLTQFLTPTAKSIGEVALERAKQIGSKAVSYLATVGRKPKPVEEKLLYPILQAASLESDPALAERWAALLANAADPAQKAPVQPGYAEVLRQLTPTDALVLQYIYRNIRPIMDSDEVRSRTDRENNGGILTAPAQEALGLDALTMQGSIDNLIRFRLSKIPEGALGGSLLLYDTFPSIGRVMPTVLGYQFLQAVTPPSH